MIAWAIAFLAAMCAALLVVQEIRKAAVDSRKKDAERFLGSLLKHEKTSKARFSDSIFLSAWRSVETNLILEKHQRHEVLSYIEQNKIDLPFIRKLQSTKPLKRCEAAYWLAFCETERSERALAHALAHEKDERVLLYLTNALVKQRNTAALPDIIDSINGTSFAHIKRISGLLMDFQSSFIALFPLLESRKEREIMLLIAEYAQIAPSRVFGQYLLRAFSDASVSEEIRSLAFRALATAYPQSIHPAEYLEDTCEEIRKTAFISLGTRAGKANAIILLKKAGEHKTGQLALSALSGMAEKSPAIFSFLQERLRTSVDETEISALSEILSGRIDYFLVNTAKTGLQIHEKIILKVLEEEKIAALISFLNNNRDPDVERTIIAIIQKHLRSRSESSRELQRYLKPSILHKIGLGSDSGPRKSSAQRKEHIRRGPLFLIPAATVLILPVTALIYLLTQEGEPLFNALAFSIERYTTVFSYYIAAVNLFYLFLGAAGRAEAAGQNQWADIIDEAFLFRPNVLPEISILAPAFNEELNIVASVQSLLNLQYPRFEVVVVNDGSTDDTLNTLIRHFNLEKTDAAFAKELKTRSISGIYRNRRIPGLTVVDKMNGGKADSLNAGINIAKGEYVLGIDADSILERNSLLHLTSIFLSEKEAPIAAGGNILPVNGCEVRDGVISKMEVPRNAVALAQTTEYLRAFMSGRLGWSKLNTLMIISGAFGLFRRSHLVELNGYLTASEKYEKDTVGEDMELVVRMARREKEAKRKGRIVYNFHAHCWTEVPEKLSILKRQRVRWQRGLIDILFYHSRMMFNPAFGTYGLLGFPYFLIVEVIGPWLEALGLVAFFGGIVLGVLPRDLILAFLAANCLLGFSVTAFSLYTSNTWKTLYSFKDRMKLYLMSVFETAGLRQLFSIYRLSGLVSALRKQHGWGAMPRTGFAKQKKKGNA